MRAHADVQATSRTNQKEDTLGSPRAGAIEKLERSDNLVELARRFLTGLDTATSDHAISASEKTWIAATGAALFAAVMQSNTDFQVMNGCLELIGTLANTADPSSAWFLRREREITSQLDKLPLTDPASLPDLPLAIAGGTHNEG